MFTRSEDVECILDKASFDKKKDDNVAILKFKIVGLEYDLAYDIGPHIADRLFRKNGNEWAPVDNVPLIRFREGIPVQDVSWRTAPDVQKRSIWLRCRVSKLEAKKSFQDQVSWTFYFTLTFAYEEKLIPGELADRLKDALFMTFAESTEPQGTLFPPAPEDPKCDVHGNDATHIGTDGSLWCDECAASAVGVEITKLG